VTDEMTEHDTHVDRAEKLRAADPVVALAGMRGSANDNSVAPLTRRPAAGDLSPSGGEMEILPPSGDQVGDSTDRRQPPRVRPNPTRLRHRPEVISRFLVRSGRVELPQS